VGAAQAAPVEQANDLLHAHLQEHPRDAAASTALGSALLMHKRIAEGTDAYARARALDSTAGAALLGEAEARLALGERRDATALYRAYLNAASGRTAAFDKIAEARLQGLVSAVPDPSAALPGQLLWGAGAGLLGAALSFGGTWLVFGGCGGSDWGCAILFGLVALPVVSASTLGGVAYGVRYAGRKHGVHGSMWRGVGGGLLGGLIAGSVGALVGTELDNRMRGEWELLAIPFAVLGGAFGAAYANNTYLLPPSAAPGAEAIRISPSKRVPSVLVLPAR
jgi:hypothetical protein